MAVTFQVLICHFYFGNPNALNSLHFHEGWFEAGIFESDIRFDLGVDEGPFSFTTTLQMCTSLL